MNFDILRQRILEKAIQGKLVPQLESEPEVAQISETLDDVPFTVPEKWKWVRILDAACINPKVIATDSNINVSFIPMAAVSAGYLNYIALKEEKPWKTVKMATLSLLIGIFLLQKSLLVFKTVNQLSHIA